MNKRIYTLMIALIIASLLVAACSGKKAVTPTNTAQPVLPTVEASATNVPPTQPPAPTPVPSTDTPAPTATAQPTQTPLPTETSTPTQQAAPTETPAPAGTPTATPAPTSSAPIAHVNEGTNCRSGPSSDYDLVATFMSGEDATIVSKTTYNTYVLVENPQNPGQSCWLYTQFVTISGDLSSLPVATPPPPLLAFTLSFIDVEFCNGGYSLAFSVVNTATKPLQSYTIVAKDITANSQQTTTNNYFDKRLGCAITLDVDYVNTGKVGYVYSDYFTYDPTGHSMQAIVTICSHQDGAGTCVSQSLRFVP